MAYQSSITRKQFALVEPLLSNARRRTRPRKYDLYILFNAVLYLIKNGCTWRDLPQDFPDYRVVYHHFRIWRDVPKGGTESILDTVLKKIGRSGAYQKWQTLLHEHGDCGRTKCPECLKRRGQRL